jgi:hypothetical protein
MRGTVGCDLRQRSEEKTGMRDDDVMKDRGAVNGSRTLPPPCPLSLSSAASCDEIQSAATHFSA